MFAGPKFNRQQQLNDGSKILTMPSNELMSITSLVPIVTIHSFIFIKETSWPKAKLRISLQYNCFVCLLLTGSGRRGWEAEWILRLSDLLFIIFQTNWCMVFTGFPVPLF